VVVPDLAEKCPYCHGKLMVVTSAPRVRRTPSPWLLLTLAGLLMFAWVVWQRLARP
jgi:hypothetical protein